MSVLSDAAARVRRADRVFIGGEWVVPSSAAAIEVSDSAREEVFPRVAEAKEPELAWAVGAARAAFDIAFGGSKQSGIGREGGTEGLRPVLELKTVILDGPPAGYGS